MKVYSELLLSCSGHSDSDSAQTEEVENGNEKYIYFRSDSSWMCALRERKKKQTKNHAGTKLARIFGCSVLYFEKKKTFCLGNWIYVRFDDTNARAAAAAASASLSLSLSLSHTLSQVQGEIEYSFVVYVRDALHLVLFYRCNFVLLLPPLPRTVPFQFGLSSFYMNLIRNVANNRNMYLRMELCRWQSLISLVSFAKRRRALFHSEEGWKFILFLSSLLIVSLGTYASIRISNQKK